MGVLLETRANRILFEAFAQFLSDFDKLNEKEGEYKNILKENGYRESKRFIFYCYIGQSLFGGIAARSVENFIRGKAPIDDDRFDLFCKKFKKTISDAPQEEKREYENIEVAFMQWSDSIYKSIGRKTIIRDEQPILIDPQKTVIEEQNIVIEEQKNTTEDAVPFLKLLNHNDFLTAFSIVEKYIDQRRSLMEGEVVKLLKRLIEGRHKVQGQSKGALKIKYKVAKDFLTDGFWEWYERDDNQVIRKVISFSSYVDTFEGFVCKVEKLNNQNELEKNFYCTVNFECNNLSISNDHPYRDEMTDFFWDLSTYDRLQLGYRIKLDMQTKDIKGGVIVLNRISKKNKSDIRLSYDQFDINDTIIPHSIRAFLTCCGDLSLSETPLKNSPLTLLEFLRLPPK